MDKCPYCGSTKGVSTSFTGYQYYSWNGKPMGYSDGETESHYVKCLECNRRISLKRIMHLSDQNDGERQD